jgi:hypothetical protein
MQVVQNAAARVTAGLPHSYYNSAPNRSSPFQVDRLQRILTGCHNILTRWPGTAIAPDIGMQTRRTGSGFGHVQGTLDARQSGPSHLIVRNDTIYLDPVQLQYRGGTRLGGSINPVLHQGKVLTYPCWLSMLLNPPPSAYL